MLKKFEKQLVLSLIIAMTEGGEWAKARLHQFLSLNPDGIEIILLDATPDASVKEDFEHYLQIYPNVRYIRCEASSPGEVFEKALKSSKATFAHIAQRGSQFDTNFFATGLATIVRFATSSLVYARPNTKHLNSHLDIPYCAMDTLFYSKSARALNCIYMATLESYELNGILKVADLNMDSKLWHHPQWKNLALLDLACNGPFFEIENSKLLLEAPPTARNFIPPSITLLKAQLSLISRNFREFKWRMPLILSTINNAIMQSFFERKTI